MRRGLATRPYLLECRMPESVAELKILADRKAQELSDREAVVKEALSWVGTPYHGNADLKGIGVDCGMFLVRVFVDTGLVKAFDPRPYPMQWALNQAAEKYLEIVLSYAREINTTSPKPGDIAMFKFGKCWAHGAIVVDWPRIVHANPRICRADNVVQNLSLARRKPFRFFSIWPR